MGKRVFGISVTIVSGVAVAMILIGVIGCGVGGGVCTRTCAAINNDLDNLGASTGDMTIDPFGPELQSLQCQAGQLALEAYDCNCDGAREQGARAEFVAAINVVCNATGTGGGVLPPGFPVPGDSPSSSDPDPPVDPSADPVFGLEFQACCVPPICVGEFCNQAFCTDASTISCPFVGGAAQGAGSTCATVTCP